MFQHREIKFRAWNKKDKKMFSWGQIQHKFDSVWWSDVNNGRFVLMQYTGVKDQNGKEIYEGDIVHVTDFFHCDDKVYKGVVKSAGGYYQIEGQGIRNSPLGWIISSDDIEVIGNIFENPELLAEVYDNA